MVMVKKWGVLEWQSPGGRAWAGRNPTGAGGRGRVSRERWPVQMSGQQHKAQAMWKQVPGKLWPGHSFHFRQSGDRCHQRGNCLTLLVRLTWPRVHNLPLRFLQGISHCNAWREGTNSPLPKGTWMDLGGRPRAAELRKLDSSSV